jgi:neutral amino acid transport system permease protein
MTVGAYTTVLLSLQGVPLWIAAPIGGLLAAFLGLLIGLTTLRLREDYLGIVMIGRFDWSIGCGETWRCPRSL